MSPLRRFFFLTFSALLIPSAYSQAVPPDAAADRTTFRTNVRIVVLDVVVTDSKDDPVTGLPRNDFEVFENGKAQTIVSFDEHSGLPDIPALTLQAKLPPNVFSNQPLAKAGDAANVLLLDSLNTPMSDQSYVHAAMIKYVKGIRPGTRLAIFTLGSRLRFVQGFTGDPAVLMAALNGKKSAGNPELSNLLQTSSEQDASRRAIDQIKELQAATNANLQGSIDALTQFQAETTSSQTDVRIKTTLEAMQRLSRYLVGIPGRKNVIWFSGSFPLNTLTISSSGPNSVMPTGLPDPSGVTRQYQYDIAKAANMLAAAQIAIYPIGAEGVAVDPHYDLSGPLPPKIAGVKVEQQMTQAQLADLQQGQTQRNSGHASMDELARDTGGEAYYNTNGFNDALDHVLNNGTHYYTLTYSPSNRTMDGQFRGIEVKLTGSKYHLAYRRGYYATDAETRPAAQPKAVGDPLRPLMDHGTPDSTEILYAMGVVPSAVQPSSIQLGPNSQRAGDNENLKGSVTRYRVNFTVSPEHLTLDPSPDGVRHGSIEVTLLGYDRDGNPLNWMVRMLQLTLPPDRFAVVQQKGLFFSLEIDVPPSGLYLRSGVYDLGSNKAGTLEIPLSSLVAQASPSK
jgi:VWFA-related protein